MRLDEAVKLSDQVRALANQLVDAITEAIEDEPPAEVASPRRAAVTRLSTWGRFRARVEEAEPVAVALSEMVASHGWIVGGAGGRSRIMAVEALERAYRFDPVSLDAALWVITSAWGYDRVGVDGRIIEGLTMVMARPLDLTRSAVADRLRLQWTPSALLDVVKHKRDEAYESVEASPRSCEILARVVAESLGRA